MVNPFRFTVKRWIEKGSALLDSLGQLSLVSLSRYTDGMSPREAEPEVSRFARQIADALALVLNQRGISKRELARNIGRSNNYVAIRFRHEAALTLTDVDVICDALGLEAGSFIAGVSGSNVITGRFRNVPAADEDLRYVANDTIDEQPAGVDSDYDNA